jgi:hypothetical protein
VDVALRSIDASFEQCGVLDVRQRQSALPLEAPLSVSLKLAGDFKDLRGHAYWTVVQYRRATMRNVGELATFGARAFCRD